jgi:ribosomal protein S18 acetylase RimI-like enzyme
MSSTDCQTKIYGPSDSDFGVRGIRFNIERNYKIGGFVIVRMCEITDELEIVYLYIYPEMRKQGLAGALLDFVEEYAKNQKKRLLRLTVVKENKDALSLYIKKGFEMFLYHIKDKTFLMNKPI